MLNVGIIGLGWWGRTLAESVQGKSRELRFTKAADLDLEPVRAFAQSHQMELVRDYRDILNDPAIHAVVIATPHTLHVGQIIQSAQAGKHVYSEKPLALNLADAMKVHAACSKMGVTLGVGHDRRLLPGIEAMQQIIQSGEVGEIVHAEAQYSNDVMSRNLSGPWRADKKEAPAGGMTGPGLHALDALLNFGLKLKAVTGHINVYQPFPNPIDAVTLLLEFDQGINGTLATVRGVPDFIRLHVFGTKGWVELRDFEHLTIHRVGQGKPEIKRFDPQLNIAAMLESFARAVQGQGEFPVKARAMLETVAAFEAVITSIQTGNKVKVASVGNVQGILDEQD